MASQDDHADDTRVAVRLPGELRAALQREAAAEGVTTPRYIRTVLERRHEADHLRDQLARCESRLERLERRLADAASEGDDGADDRASTATATLAETEYRWVPWAGDG
jgi:chromosome segregation ATPase